MWTLVTYRYGAWLQAAVGTRKQMETALLHAPENVWCFIQPI